MHTILSHLTNQPQFRFLKKQACYEKYIKLLGAKYQKAVAFIYIKNHTLFIAVTHPGFKMELNYNKDLLKSLLTQLRRYDQTCEMMQAEQIVIFHSRYHPLTPPKTEATTVPYYEEQSSAEFAILTEDSKLKEKFEKIQQQIKGVDR